MKKLVAILLGIMLATVSMVAFADAPTSDAFTTQPLYGLENKVDGDFYFNAYTNSDGKTDGWMFYPDSANNMVLTIEDNKMVIADHYNGYMELRIDIAEELRLDAATSANYDMVGFYVENNTTETAGIAFFGENSDGNVAHQMAYQSTDFYDIECYLVDLNGNIYVAQEYLDDYGHGLAELPAGFKGYFMVTLDTCGHDYCSYGAWGLHSCDDNGAWHSGDVFFKAVGLGLYSLWADEGETFVIDDWFLAKKGDSFSATENNPGETTTETPDNNTTDAPEQTTTENAGDVTDNPTDGATDEPAPSQGMDTTTIIIIVAAVVVVVVAVVVVLMLKKKKAE